MSGFPNWGSSALGATSRKCRTLAGRPAARASSKPGSPPVATAPEDSRPPALCGPRHAEDMGAGMKQQPDRTADEGAVDADELQILADFQLDFPTDLFRVPALHYLRDHAGDLSAITDSDPANGAQ